MTDNDIINKVFLKPEYDTRTFESRLLFIKDLFEHTFDKSIIMGRSIQYKLGKNLAVNEEAIANSYDELAEADPLVLLNKIKEIR
jgi:hypothetical protein